MTNILKEHPLSGGYYEPKGAEFNSHRETELRLFIAELNQYNFDKKTKHLRKGNKRYLFIELLYHLRKINQHLALSHGRPHCSIQEWKEIVNFNHSYFFTA